MIRDLLGVHPPLRGNLHTHSTRSDGHLCPDDLLTWYRNAGYDFLAITDHQVEPRPTITTGSPVEGILLVPGGEFHPQSTRHGDRWHIIAAGVPADFDATPYDDDPTGLVRHLDSAGAWVSIAHPSGQGVDAADVEQLGPVHAIEIYNERSRWWDERVDGWYLADALACRGLRIGGVAVDDAHFDGRPDHGHGWVMVEATDRSVDAVIGALKDGRYYASQGPRIDALSLTADTLRLRCTPVEAIFAAGRGQIVKSVIGDNLVEAEIPLAPFRGGYVRITIRNSSGQRAWSNPIHV
ncbi:CehA/McbA family metallohydrolase [Streptomyces sp. NPDC001508]|uniref:CehA/McbA family metallohydrolase n=1 Tax=Streptomyces sp. NPDC001508 TaxID=3154656 RepID=UPI00331917E7